MGHYITYLYINVFYFNILLPFYGGGHYFERKREFRDKIGLFTCRSRLRDWLGEHLAVSMDGW